MKQALCKELLKLFGWKLGEIVEDIPKSIICVAPHTSNLDFIIGKLFYTSIGRNACFLIKKEWYFFPLNYLFKYLGGIPINRSKSESITDQMTERFNHREKFQLAITPEATRKRASTWKRGFYYIALKAKVPIMIAYLDYKKREIGFKDVYFPTGDAEADIKTIRSYYTNVTACHPENFDSSVE